MATKTAKSAKTEVFYATGRRKTSAARVFLKAGSGKITINGKSPEAYLTTPSSRVMALGPLSIIPDAKVKFDAQVTVVGGGIGGQADAIRHGLARALVVANPESRGDLKKAGMLTRDAREVERKKYGKHKARKSTQFSKR